MDDIDSDKVIGECDISRPYDQHQISLKIVDDRAWDNNPELSLVIETGEARSHSSRTRHQFDISDPQMLTTIGNLFLEAARIITEKNEEDLKQLR